MTIPQETANNIGELNIKCPIDEIMLFKCENINFQHIVTHFLVEKKKEWRGTTRENTVYHSGDTD